MMSSPPQVLGISGSPRRKGNTETLIKEILSGAETAGASTGLEILDEMDIQPCKGCFGCSKTHKCIQEDDFNGLANTMKQSAVWVLGTPIYWWGPTAQFKAFLDRWISIGRTTFRGKKVVIAIPMGGGSDSYARHTVAMFEDIFSYLGMDHIATVLAPGSDGRDAVRNSSQLLELARRVGLGLASEL
ncbi:MAG: flavodoxin family protein [Promethearchaeota archaeon]